MPLPYRPSTLVTAYSGAGIFTCANAALYFISLRDCAFNIPACKCFMIKRNFLLASAFRVSSARAERAELFYFISLRDCIFNLLCWRCSSEKEFFFLKEINSRIPRVLRLHEMKSLRNKIRK